LVGIAVSLLLRSDHRVGGGIAAYSIVKWL